LPDIVSTTDVDWASLRHTWGYFIGTLWRDRNNA
jgi:hypothetical protein